MLIYFAGPLFNQAELEFNAGLTDKLEALGYDVFLPQRDGVESSKPPYTDMTREERRRATFELDRDQIITADIFMIILDGRVPDEGAAVELGIAYMDKRLTHPNKYLVGLQTDVRAAFMNSRLNPMLRVPLDLIASTVEELIANLDRHRKEAD
ncbi:nucleoside 2-deoxyribosyltransferase [Candidatus Saccharibacteria bacterium]|nr:nucleoside 2-deoxyribosyltransferase [Candidatus Saccharibacteria bacterium]